MKTRTRDRHSAKNQPDSQNRPVGEGVCFEERSSLKSSGKTSDSSDHPQSIISTTSVLEDNKQHQDITSTNSVLTNTSEARIIHSGLSHPNFAGVMAERQSPSQNRQESSAPSAAEQAVCGLVQSVQSPTQSRQTSPVHLTELVSSTVGKTDYPLSDKNHNLPPMYVTTSQRLQCSTPTQYIVKAEGKGFSDPSVVGNTGFATNYYYHNSNEGKKMDISSSTHYSISPESCVYPKDSLYPPQYSFDTQTCKVFSFCSMDTGREYSPPEMATYNTRTSYTSPLTSSITSSGSPESVHWSPDSTHVLPSDACLPKSTAGQPALPLQEALPETGGKSVSEAHSSIHITYYSDDQSLGEDSMQDIKQDILTSDIHKHIYQNFSQNLTLSSLDEDSQDQFEDVSPGRGGSSGKTGSSSKKRRRRTQTPIQRKAANMRERKRMCHLNTAFNCLKDRLPNVRNRKKLSRIQTLKAAIFYIGLLSECLQTS